MPDAGLRIHAFCLVCAHDEYLDLELAAERLGRDHSVPPAYLVPRIFCKACLSRNVSTVLAPAGQDVPKDQIKHVKAKWKERDRPEGEGTA